MAPSCLLGARMRNLFLRRFRAGRLITLVAVITVGGLLSAVPAVTETASGQHFFRSLCFSINPAS